MQFLNSNLSQSVNIDATVGQQQLKTSTQSTACSNSSVNQTHSRVVYSTVEQSVDTHTNTFSDNTALSTRRCSAIHLTVGQRHQRLSNIGGDEMA